MNWSTCLTMFVFGTSCLTPLAAQSTGGVGTFAQYGLQANWEATLTLDRGDVQFRELWHATPGMGRGQVVGDAATVYVASGESSKAKSTDGTEIRTQVVALDTLSGQQKWRFDFPLAEMHDDQETFGGAQASPNATPALIEGRIVAISFTGHLVCLDCRDGQLLWEKDLVEAFGAEPVQFGFAASPVANRTAPGQIVVFAGGSEGGLLNLDLASGEVLWRCAVTTFSYATPLLARLGGIEQWLVISQFEVMGVAARDGKQLWRHPLPNPELTNVPSPCVLNDTDFIVSGQGSGGTRRISVQRRGETWSTREVWSQPRVQFFYTNSRVVGSHSMIGCIDQFLTWIDTTDGSILGKWRGFNDGNLLAVNDSLFVLDARGTCHVIWPQSDTDNLDSTSLVLEARYQLAEGRCWVPPTVIGERLFVRCDDGVTCYSVSSGEQASSPSTVSPLPNLLTSPRQLALKASDEEPESDPVARILQAYDTEGQEAAIKLYEDLRARRVLTVDQRLMLADIAKQSGLIDLARRILNQAREDLPDSKQIDDALEALRRRN